MNDTNKKDQVVGGLGLVGELKKWSEKTSEEKLESLRNEIRMNRYLVRRIVELEKSIRKLSEHEHSNGKVVIPVTYRDYGDECSTYDGLA